MSDYYVESYDDLPLFESRIEQHDPPNTTEIEKRLVAVLQPAGTEHKISWLRREFYDRVETIVHRLRQQKHVIDTVNGHYIYRHGPPIGWKKTPKGTHEKYMNTSHWRQLSRARIDLGGCCTLCKQTRPDVVLNAHHWRYNLFSENLQYDLQTFCESCHQSLHGLIARSGVHFPRHLPAETLERIERECQN
jgi:hypothetical protein